MATIRHTLSHNSGIPLGGIGTGTIEVRPDGYFHEWQIFNLSFWAGPHKVGEKPDWPEMRPGALSFYVRTQQEGERPLCRRLGARYDQSNLYSYAWLKNISEIEFEGRYPVATLRYGDADLPVEISAQMFSPVIPHDSRTSGTPGFQAVYRVRNRSARPVEFSLLGSLQNPLAWGAKERRLRNKVSERDGATLLTMRTRGTGGDMATHGSLTMAMSGGSQSWIAGEFQGFMQGYAVTHWVGSNTPYGMAHEGYLHDFRSAGGLPCGGRNVVSPAQLLRMDDAALAATSASERDRLIRALRQHAFVESLWQRVTQVRGHAPRAGAERLEFLGEVRFRLDTLAGKGRDNASWGDAALCSQITLAPQEEREIVFTLGWHFPNHFSALGPRLGHMYEHWFSDSEAVAKFLVDHHSEHRQRTFAFAAALYDTTLDERLPDAWSGQLSTLAKCSWWTRTGDFAIWEGMGCCGFHTTDITYQGSFGILALFPDLQKRQMLMGARFQRVDGRVHHFFTPDLSKVDGGFDRVDMNQQFVLLACRDYLWTGDRAYLRRLWPHICRAMDNTALLDHNGDGLPDHDTRRNTYDSWNFRGTPAYVASLWLAALVAAARLAGEMGDRRRGAQWRALLRKATPAFERALWNGEYYSLWVDGRERDECCMTDQIDGEWFTSLIGLGHTLSRERIIGALRAMMRWNFSPEDGLVNGSYPPRRKPQMDAYQNVQAMAPWTGIEYSIGSMMFDFGLVAEGMAVVGNVHERHLRAGRFWNHGECGDHYYRAMASWAVLLAATGFKVDVPRESVTFAPPVGGAPLRAPWFASSGWGSFEAGSQGFDLRCSAGMLSFRELRLRAPRAGMVTLNGRRLGCRVRASEGLAVCRFERRVRMKKDDILRVE